MWPLSAHAVHSYVLPDSPVCCLIRQRWNEKQGCDIQSLKAGWAKLRNAHCSCHYISCQGPHPIWLRPPFSASEADRDRDILGTAGHSLYKINLNILSANIGEVTVPQPTRGAAKRCFPNISYMDSRHFVVKMRQ